MERPFTDTSLCSTIKVSRSGSSKRERGRRCIKYPRTRLTITAILYKSLGIGSHTILALAAVYGTIAFLSNALTTKYMTDQWGRRKYVNPFGQTGTNLTPPALPTPATNVCLHAGC